MFLESRLDADVPFRRYIVGAYEDTLHVIRDSLDAVGGAVFGDLGHYFVVVEAELLRYLLEQGIGLYQDVIVHDIAHVRQRVNRFDTARGARYDADRAGRRDGRGRRVAQRCRSRGSVIRLRKVGERAPLLRQVLGGAL